MSTWRGGSWLSTGVDWKATLRRSSSGLSGERLVSVREVQLVIVEDYRVAFGRD